MATINERVKQVRLALNKSQTEFAAALGFRQSGITMIETGRRAVNDRHIKVICNMFGVSEEWLRNGTGEMYVNDTDTVVAQLQARYADDERMKNLIAAFFRLTDEQQSALLSGMDALIKANEQEQQPHEETKEEYRARLHRELDEQLDLEEKGMERSSVSTRLKSSAD